MRGNKWYPNEINKLKKIFSNKSNFELVSDFPRHSFKSIEKKASTLGYAKTFKHVCKAISKSKRKDDQLLKEWMGKDKLIGRPVLVNRRVLELRSGKDYAELGLFGDLHYGAMGCDIERAQRQLDYYLLKRVYVLLMGDLIDCGLKSSVGDSVYEQKAQVQEQLDFIFDLLKPLANAGLIIGMYSGNHEFRVKKEVGLDISKIWAKFLNIPYLGAAGWNILKVGNQKYTLYGLHGSSGSRFVYTKLKALVDISHSFDSDIIAMGHVHELDSTFQVVQKIEGETIIERKKLLVITGHYLKYEGGYVQRLGYPISKLGSPKLKLFGNKKDIHVSN